MAKAIASGNATMPTTTPETMFGSQCLRSSRPARYASSNAGKSERLFYAPPARILVGR